ncbi:phage tail protein [Cellulosimicrobium marinum]|uniref:phage tail protein n=1 Tax=Cellulosimicrobium marinum TaxID=1638992 RepID=UPI001E65B03C|nr:phage tail protein [Cellulosimicrobium marinum]MCB7134950.1 phage tail protein [Cellulosimicrobium marinum]
MTTIHEETTLAVGIRYRILLDDWNLGLFSACSGLGAEVTVETREEGGNNGAVWQLPTRLRFPNVTLTRPLNKDSAKIGEWFTTMVTSGYRFGTATIDAMTASGTEVARFGLMGVVPVRWSGPTLSTTDSNVVVESVEIAHHGFVPPKAGG